MLALRHLDIKEKKKIEEIRRIQIPQIYHEKGKFLATDRRTDRQTETFQPSELGYLVPTAHQNVNTAGLC